MFGHKHILPRRLADANQGMSPFRRSHARGLVDRVPVRSVDCSTSVRRARCLAVIVTRVATERKSHPLERSKDYCYVGALEVIAPGDSATPEERSKLAAEPPLVVPGDGASEGSKWNRSALIGVMPIATRSVSQDCPRHTLKGRKMRFLQL